MMILDKYTFEDLIKRFDEHHKIFIKENKEWNKNMGIAKEDWEFSLPLALKIICEGIKDLKNEKIS